MIDYFIKKDPSVKRHIAKTITWRIVGTLDTMTVAWIVTGNPITGVKIGGVEVMTKMILYFLHERIWFKLNFGLPNRERKKNILSATENVRQQNFYLSRDSFSFQNEHLSKVIWFTGLSGSGKSTLANELSKLLYDKKIKVFVLDGDNTRLGINKGLGFSLEDRKENIRRVAEIAKLFMDSGTVVITSFISPTEEVRNIAREIIGPEDFIEVFVECPLEICESRDVKGLYAKARAGKIKDFTGIDSPFEQPLMADITVNTSTTSIDSCVYEIYEVLKDSIIVDTAVKS